MIMASQNITHPKVMVDKYEMVSLLRDYTIKFMRILTPVSVSSQYKY